MPPSTTKPQLLLIQIRTDPRSLRQEHEWFAGRLGVPAPELHTINLVERPGIRRSDVERFDAVFIGGAGAHTAHEDHPFTAPLLDVVAWLVAAGRPLFGSCWGHQFLARVLGGTVITDPAAEEVGTFDVELTPRGREDALFSGLPPVFAAQFGHHDRIGALPAGLVELARSARCPFQAVRVSGKPVYGTQFHPEMDHEQLRRRLEIYRDSYLPGPAGHETLLSSLRPSPEASTLLRRFLELHVL